MGVSEVVFLEPPQEVPRRLEVVVLGVVRPLAVDLGVRRGGLGGGVDDDLGFVDRQQFVDEGLLGEVALDEGEVRQPVDLASRVEAFVDTGDRCRARRADVLDPLSSGEVVDKQHSVVRSVRDSQCGRPPDVAVAASDEDGHSYSVSE